VNLDDLLKVAVQRGASDLHLKVGSSPVMRIDGELVQMQEKERVSPADLAAAIEKMMNSGQLEKFKLKHDADLAYSVAGLGRFRVNVFQQRSSVGIVFRIIPMRILTIKDLNLPVVLEKMSMESRGMVLVTGTTGSGKSTTLAAMIDQINANRTSHILTIEDPIEYLFRDKKSLVNQREVGFDTDEFSHALRQALRQDPDVIMVGEMRDKDTIETALTAAETGHLVFSTLHTSDATETVNRIISVFPPHQHQQVRMQLASVLKGIVSMRLVPRADGKGRVPAVEVLVATVTVKEAITDPDKTKYISDVMSTGGSQYGMQTFDQALLDLYRKELITYEEALTQSTNPEDFALKVRGVQSTSDLATEQQSTFGAQPSRPGRFTPGQKPNAAQPPGAMKIDRFGE
jgi:twitching motility protein PilT